MQLDDGRLLIIIGTSVFGSGLIVRIEEGKEPESPIENKRYWALIRFASPSLPYSIGCLSAVKRREMF